MKDALFNLPNVRKISTEIKAVYEPFKQKEFEEDVLKKFPSLELKERIYHIRDTLHVYLPKAFKTAVNILLEALPDELDHDTKDDDFGDFIYASYSEYVTHFGCNEGYLAFSLSALKEITKRFSAEFAIRDFINHFPKETMAMLEACSLSENYHQRRLTSEGLRPKLPWAKKIETDYKDAIHLLDNLFYDKCRFVTRSVANHLNDISKIDAPLVLETLKRWENSKKQSPEEIAFITRHALRTLVKNGDKPALAFLGYSANPSIEVKHFEIDKREIVIGEALCFSFSIQAQREEKLIVDYVVHFLTKSGKSNPKVHKIKKLILPKGETTYITKKHPFKANMSSRKLYAGEHLIELQINGDIIKSAVFTLKERS